MLYLLGSLGSAFLLQASTPGFDPREAYLAHIAAAESALRLGEGASARRWLEAVPEPVRGWEWRWLDASSDESLLRRRVSELGLGTVAASADGMRLAVSGADGVVRILDAASLAELQALAGHESQVYHVAFDPAGERLLSSSHDRRVRLWDLASGTCVRIFEGHANPVAAAAFSPDGALVASCSYERLSGPPYVQGVVHVWEPDTGAIVETLRGGVKPLSSLV